jgi:putative acetyltransferase
MHSELDIVAARAPTPAVRLLVSELEAELSANYPSEQRHGLSLDAIFQDHIRFFVASSAGAPAGCAGVALTDGVAELKRMYVRPAFRGRGVAPALLATIEAVARAAGHRVLLLETGTLQHAALQFYRREGFSECGAFGEYERMQPHAIAGSVFMRKDLRAAV